METTQNWPWDKTLALAGQGALFQVEEILFGTIRDHLWEMGVRKGSMIECVENRSQGVRVRMPDGRTEDVARAYAWFIRIRPTSGNGTPTSEQGPSVEEDRLENLRDLQEDTPSGDR